MLDIHPPRCPGVDLSEAEKHDYVNAASNILALTKSSSHFELSSRREPAVIDYDSTGVR